MVEPVDPLQGGVLDLVEPVGANYSVTSCDLRVLMDQPTEPISSDYSASRRQDSWSVGLERWCLPQGAVGAVTVVVIDVLGQHRPQLPASEDQHPIKQLPPNGPYPPLSVAVVVCDVTRPFPAVRVLPVLLEELDPLGPATVSVFVATGTHRQCTAAELEQMLGPQVLGRCQVFQHDAFDRARHRDLGPVPGTAVRALVEGAFLDHAVRITTGFIEPHFFAGFSGGPKMVAPGLAALETVLELHSAARIGDPRATWGVTAGNPVHDGVRAVAGRAGVTFNLDVTLDRRHVITNVFAGELLASHAAGCRFAHQTAMVRVEAPYDVVVTTNSGWPLDQNLYQSVKGLSAAAQIVREGGSIVLASECSDGLPEHGGYGGLLRGASGPEAFLHALATQDVAVHDQWQVQVQAQIQRKARVFVKADGVAPDQLRTAWFEPVDDLAACVAREIAAAGPGARLAVVPDGPQTIPYVG